MLDQFLHHTESLFVDGQHLKVADNFVEDVLLPFFGEGLNDLLDHVLPLDVFGQSADVVILGKGLLYYFVLFVLREGFDDCLQNPRSSVVAGYFYEFFSFNFSKKRDALMDLEVVNEHRAKVVAVVVGHQLGQVVFHLLDDLVYKALLALGQVLLQELGAYFLLGELQNLSFQDLEFKSWVFICKFNVVLDLK